MKYRPTIFHAWVGLCGFPKKNAGTRYAELVLLHPVESTGHVVHSGASEVRNVVTLFFITVCI
jgi:hypothetical protein